MTNKNDKPEFWESAFAEKKEMWGFEPAHSAVLAKDLFIRNNVKTVLVPGFGYGRNAKLLQDAGMIVTGIEISKTAIDMARRHYGTEMTLYHGSVTDMPFDTLLYDAVFCYALIHLLDGHERAKLILDCYAHLNEGGYMVFTVISKEAPTYGTGELLSKDCYAQFGGVNMFFYDRESIQAEFGPAGLLEIREVKENFPFFLIICKKPSS